MTAPANDRREVLAAVLHEQHMAEFTRYAEEGDDFPAGDCGNCQRWSGCALAAQEGERGCPTPGCPGDVRYAAPGRSHIDGCTYPRNLTATTELADFDVDGHLHACPRAGECGCAGLLYVLAQEGERGGAEVAAAVEDYADRPWDAAESPHNRAFDSPSAERNLTWREVSRQLRTIVADSAGALAKHDAEVLRAAADDLYGDHGPDHPLSVATWLRERADRIAGDQP